MSRTLAKIKAAGFEVGLEGGNLAISPFSKLTPVQVQFLTAHKAEIVAALEQEQAANGMAHDPEDDRHYCRECRKLVGGCCLASPTSYHPVDTHPRRCGDFVA